MFQSHDLISKPYLEMQRCLHSKPEGYGGKGKKWAEAAIWVARRYDAQSILDYGCGRGSLAKALRAQEWRCAEYDPAIPGKQQLPNFADLVVCTDVLEHVERDHLEAVLGHIRALARKAVFLVIALDPANKILSDGRNAHLIQESPAWWASRLAASGFALQDVPDLPVPPQFMNSLKREKRWIGVCTP